MQQGFIFSISILIALTFLGLALTYITSIILVPARMTSSKIISEILSIIALKPGQTIFDLGAGDFRVLLRAVLDYNAKAIGYEISPILILAGKFKKLIRLPKSRKLEIKAENFFKADLSYADTVYCHLNEKALNSLKLKFKEQLSQEAAIFSYEYEIPDSKAEKVHELSNGKKMYVYNKNSF